MNAATDDRWYVARTHPHVEAKAQAHLHRQGFATYLPQYLKKRRHARRFDTVQAPLFPCYLFVAIDIQRQRWRSISSTVGVSHLVGNGDHPTEVASTVINPYAHAKTQADWCSCLNVHALRQATKCVFSTAPLSIALAYLRA